MTRQERFACITRRNLEVSLSIQTAATPGLHNIRGKKKGIDFLHTG